MRAAAMLLVSSLVLVACANDRAPEPTPNEAADSGSLDLENVETVAGELSIPWDVAFADEQTILVTERTGAVRVIEDGRVRPEPAAEIDVRISGEGGLLGLALHPDFPDERVAYLYYTAGDENRVSRFTLDASLRFGDEETVIDGIPAGRIHDGGRIAFGPDGMLYVGTGDAGNGAQAADRDSLAGKILRVTPDGSVPDDNPFAGSAVYSYGHRNVQGLAWDDNGRLYASEHGPTGEAGLCCHDEINRIEPGSFYGWPYLAGAEPAEEGEAPAEPVAPLAESGETTWAPAGLTVHQPTDGPAEVLVATLRGERLLRFELAGDDVESPDAILEGFGRLRAARFGPDDCLYLTTSNTDGRGTAQDDDDRILRACPSE